MTDVLIILFMFTSWSLAFDVYMHGILLALKRFSQQIILFLLKYKYTLFEIMHFNARNYS